MSDIILDGKEFDEMVSNLNKVFERGWMSLKERRMKQRTLYLRHEGGLRGSC